MRLHIRLLIISALVAAPTSVAIVMVLNALRGHDQTTTIDRLVDASLTQHVRESCETDPNWFLAGPREAPPSLAERALPDAEVRLPRPRADELPLEFYAYNDQFEAQSTAAPRFPVDFRNALRASPPVRFVRGPFETRDGTGIQMARMTGWSGPCAVLLFRLRPYPNHLSESVYLFAGLFVTCVLVSAVVAGPTVLRIRELAQAERDSARQDYGGMAPVHGRDEIASLGAMFNEASADIRRRITDSRDREEALRRYVADVTDGIAAPLSDLETRLLSVHPDRSGADAGAARIDAARRAHQLSTRLLNLAAAARLRTSRERLAREPVDMNAVVARVLATLAPLAAAGGVTMTAAMPQTPAVITGDPVLLERAIGNLVDNALLYNQPGGRVLVEIAQYERHGRFSLRVTDTGRGMSDEEFTGLNAIRRFRGDEGRERRPGAPGLGLAVAREVAERFGFGLELRRPAAGGFEVEFAGTGSRMGE
jgi:signal transduction histidine kinase